MFNPQGKAFEMMTIIRKMAWVLVVAGVALSQAALASTIALTWSSGGAAGSSPQTRGWAFDTHDTITVTALGWYDAIFGPNLPGLVDSHQVAIWDSAGVLLLTGTVASGTADPLIGDFRYTTGLSGSLTLTPGSYVIGGLANNPALNWRMVPAANVTTPPEIEYLQNRNNNDPGVFSFPAFQTQPNLEVGYFGPNFQFDVTAVPLPSSLVLLA